VNHAPQLPPKRIVTQRLTATTGHLVDTIAPQ